MSACFILTMAGCGDENDDSNLAAGGSSGLAGFGGASSGGSSGMSMGGSAGTGTAGAGSSTNAAGSGGQVIGAGGVVGGAGGLTAAGGVAAGGLGGIGGDPANGGGGTDAGAPDAAGGHTPSPSAGCGKAGRPDGGVVMVPGSHIYSFPESYDGNSPLPLIMAFHAANNQNDQLRNITRNSPLADHFAMAFPKSQGSGWSLGADSPRIDATFDDLFENYCIDTSRVFATGHSSGAQLIVQLMCQSDERFFAIAPVASSAYCPTWSPSTPALVIHGVNDRERANTNQDADGTKDLAPYLSSNGCSMTSQPYEQAGCRSGSTDVTPGCVQFEECTETTIWCHHNDPQYGSTNHGWPCFANSAIDSFFTSFL